MNLKTVYATLAAFVIFFFLGWLVFAVLLMNFYDANSMHYEGLNKEYPNMVLLVLANLVWAFFFAYVLQRWAKTTDFGKGFIAGLIIGFFVTLCFDLYFLSMLNLYNTKLFVVDIIVNTVISGIAGGVIGWVLGFGMKKEAS